jgi:hypothetical protein
MAAVAGLRAEEAMMSLTTPDMENTMNAQYTPREKEVHRKGQSPGRNVKSMLKGIAVALGTGLIFWLLWNWVAVPLFAFPSLTYLQGLGAVLLTAVLGGTVRCIGGHHGAETNGQASGCRGGFHKCQPHRAGGE